MQDLVIHNIFSQVAARIPREVALQAKEGSRWVRFSYGEVEKAAVSIAAFLVKEGYKKGECAGIILENSCQWGIIYLGMMYAGLVCVALDCELASEDLDNIFRDCRPVIIFTSLNIYRNKLVDIAYKVGNIIVDSGDFERIKAGSEDITLPEVLPSDVASLIYTSGTTARPKGVVLTHGNFCSNFRSIEKLAICTGKDNFLSILPLYHTYAFMVTLLFPLLIGAKITYAKAFKPEDLTQVIKEANVSILTGVPQLFSLIRKAIFDKFKSLPFWVRPLVMPAIRKKIRNKFGKALRLFISGGARLEPGIGKDLSSLGFQVIEGYGLTETSPVVTFNPPGKQKFGTVGKPIPDVQIKIVNPDEDGVGEVFIKGPNLMQGYFRQPDLTASLKSEDGWFNSQDLGYLDKEGYLVLTGRKKDVIVLSSGKNIYPDELEEYYIQSPYIKEICILEKIDEKFQQQVKLLFAVVVPDFGYFRKKKELNVRDKLRWELENLSAKLPAYKRIMGFVVSKDELPRTRLKKIKRFEIYQRFLGYASSQEAEKEELLSSEDKVILDSAAAGKIISYLAFQLNKAVSLNSHLELDLGIDSLGRVELASGLESILSIEIPQELIESVLTVKELIIQIERLSRASAGLAVSPEQKTWNQILNQNSPDELLDKIKLNYGLLDKLLTLIFKALFEGFFRVFYSLRVSGRRNIPPSGPYIFCPNHASFYDGFILLSSVPFKCAINLFFIGHAKIFQRPLIKWAVKVARLISIDPVDHLSESLQASRFVLGKNKVICIFPEGARSIAGYVEEFKKGVGILAKELNIPLLPVYIKGSEFAWPRTRKFPRIHPLRIIFGKPVLWHDLGSDYEGIVEGLRKEVIKLKNQSDSKKR